MPPEPHRRRPEDQSAPSRPGTSLPPDLDEDEAEYADAASGRRHTRDPRASMTLITSMLERPLDPGYAAAAEQREAAGLPRATSWRSPRLLVWMIVLGLVVGISAAALRDRDGQRQEARDGLIAQIQARQGGVEQESEQARALQRQIDLAAGDVGEGSTVQRLRVANGAVAVRGPGLRITLDDAPGSGTSADGDPRSSEDDDGRVLSRDLQIVTNGLWESGAEAIAVNGQRLTSRSAIRFAGDAILVNFRPLTRPYVIEAVGDPEGMQSAFAAGDAGPYLTGLQTNFDVQTSLTVQDELTLPSAVITTTRYATVPEADRESPTITPSEEDQ